MRRRTPASRALRLRPRWPHVLAWTVMLGLALAVLVTLAYLSGREQPPPSSSVPESVLTTLAEPAVALVLAFGALTLAAWAFRQLWLELLAYLPGGIGVPDFATAGELAGVDPAQLTMRFRQRLAVSHLQSVAPVPANARQGDFLDVLGQSGIDAGNLLGSLLALLRAAKPPHAYEIKGVLIGRRASPSHGVAIEVIRLPGDAIRVETLWDSSWPRVLRRAADHATASILTRTRRCAAPWVGWRRYPMPGALFYDYEYAAELEEERRYDEALDRYYRALGRDPLNVGLRLQIGFLQEKIGLPLDALATYEGMEAVARPGGDERPRALDRSAARRERDAVITIARYRRAVLLAQEELARQWRRTGPADESAWTQRDRQRRQLRRRLAPALERMFDPVDTPRAGPESRIGATPRAKLLREPPPGSTASDHDRDLLELQELLQLAARREMAELRKEAKGPLRGRDTTLTAAAAGLSEVCMRQRLAWTRAALAPGSAGEERPDAAQVGAELARVEPRTGFNSWQELYNAACAYALPLIPAPDPSAPGDGERRDALAQAAVTHLERAMARVDSAYVSGRRNWLISEDPDLDGLRAHPSFKLFEAMYFPSPRPTPQRPRDLHQWELSRYTHDLLTATAWRWEDCWQRRGRRLDSKPDLHEMLEWWADEARAWERVQHVARHHRHWRARYELVEDMHGWTAKYGLEPLSIPFPRYSDELSGDPEGSVDPDAAERVVADRDARLRRLVALIARVEREKQEACSLLGDIRRWQAELRQLNIDGQRARRWHVARLCDAHAALWGRLHEWLDAAVDEADHRPLEASIAHTAALWRAADLRYRSGDVIRGVPWRLRPNGLRNGRTRAAGVPK